MGEGRLHELPDQRALAAQCTRFSHTLMRPAELPKVLARAFAVFDSARPGPVHIELPLDVITAPAEFRAPWPRSVPPVAATQAVAQLAARLQAAQRPCLLCGGGAVGAATELRELAERLAMPVVTTVNGKGILPRGHPLSVGGSPSVGAVRELLAASDCVLAVGTEFGETDYDMLFAGALPDLAWLARIDIDAQQLCRNVAADLPVCGDRAGPAVSACSAGAQLPAASARRRWTERSAAQGPRAPGPHRDVRRGATCQRRHAVAFFERLQRALPDLLLVGDSTLPCYYAVWQYEAQAPRRYFHSAPPEAARSGSRFPRR
jgi:acetolactate synthase-1/2/3 large subunit